VRLTIYCGSSTGASPAYADAARDLGKLLAERGIGVVYGGASVGTMGSLADAALSAGGEVIGVIPSALVKREVARHDLTEVHVVETMHERKALMIDLGDGFVSLPGGAGTLEELFEIWSWTLLGILHKPVGLLNVRGYYDKLIGFLDHMVTEGFVDSLQRAALLVEEDPTRLLERFTSYRPPQPKYTRTGPTDGVPAVVETEDPRARGELR
jgi:uncharacterized protein (TIGR00730 family)